MASEPRVDERGSVVYGGWYDLARAINPEGGRVSSAKVELRAVTRAHGEAEDSKPLGQYFGDDLRMRAFIDAQATRGRSHLAGTGQAPAQRDSRAFDTGQTTASRVRVWSR